MNLSIRFFHIHRFLHTTKIHSLRNMQCSTRCSHCLRFESAICMRFHRAHIQHTQTQRVRQKLTWIRLHGTNSWFSCVRFVFKMRIKIKALFLKRKTNFNKKWTLTRNRGEKESKTALCHWTIQMRCFCRARNATLQLEITSHGNNFKGKFYFIIYLQQDLSAFVVASLQKQWSTVEKGGKQSTTV